jgi:hypothetical protein
MSGPKARYLHTTAGTPTIQEYQSIEELIVTGGVFTWLIINLLKKEVVRPRLNVCETE